MTKRLQKIMDRLHNVSIGVPGGGCVVDSDEARAILAEVKRLEAARQEAQESYNAAKGELANMQAELKAMAGGGA